MRGITGLFLLLLAIACQPTTAPADLDPTRDVSGAERVLATDRDSYAAGSVAVIRLTNRYDHALGYNLCHSVLERQQGVAWETAPREGDRVCTMELRLLDPGRSVTYEFRLASSLPAGAYRFRTTLENMRTGAREPVVSNAFTVTR